MGRAGAPIPAAPARRTLVLKPEHAKAYEARRAADAEGYGAANAPSAAILCAPYGMPRMMSVATYPMEVLQTPGQVTIITEAFSEVRRVFLNAQQPIEEVPPGHYGHSVGRWDGRRWSSTRSASGNPCRATATCHSSRMRITERLKLITPDVLHDRLRSTIRSSSRSPVIYTLAYRRLPGYQMVEFVRENNRGACRRAGQSADEAARPLTREAP